MSKAIEKAYKAYPLNEENHLNHGWNAKRVGFQQGYEQAEKDLELTWEDVKLIIDIVDSENLRPHLFDEIDYQEVLNRFNKQKGK